MIDLLIIGGGINGAGIARDAALRGLSVHLCEKQDFAGGTSSASSKLIHGGLRYLEQGEFRLVRKSLHEQARLQHLGAHLISPLDFILPIDNSLRSPWLVRLGLWLYDWLAPKGSRPKSRKIRLQELEARPLKPSFTAGFQYTDCWADDARLVIANLQHAAKHGATIQNYCTIVTIIPEKDHWSVTLADHAGHETTVQCRVLVNATGPWVGQTARQWQLPFPHSLQLVKGSHFIVPNTLKLQQAYILQAPDKRVVFVLPYVSDWLLIGTTDVPIDEDSLSNQAITDGEIDYLLTTVNHYLASMLRRENIVGSFSGTRALIADNGKAAHALSRDYLLELCQGKTPPCLHVVGGKLTTYRRLAEKSLSMLEGVLTHMHKNRSRDMPLPGSDSPTPWPHYQKHLRNSYPWLPPDLLERYLAQYGTQIDSLLQGCRSVNDLGTSFSEDLYQREVDYLRQEEWAVTAEDILWRRTKLGLKFSDKECEALNAYLAQIR